MSGVRVPYLIAIKKRSDLITLENALRALLQCQGRTCAFLQSAEYALFKFNACHALLRVPRQAQFGDLGASDDDNNTTADAIYIPGSTLYMHIAPDKLHVIVRSKTAALVEYNPMLAPRKETQAAKGKREAGTSGGISAEGRCEIRSLLASFASSSCLGSLSAKKRKRKDFKGGRGMTTAASGGTTAAVAEDVESTHSFRYRPYAAASKKQKLLGCTAHRAARNGSCSEDSDDDDADSREEEDEDDDDDEDEERREGGSRFAANDATKKDVLFSADETMIKKSKRRSRKQNEANFLKALGRVII